MLKGTLTIGFMWVLLCGSAIGQTSGALPYSDDPMEQFRQAMERRSIKAAWSAVIIVQQGAGTKNAILNERMRCGANSGTNWLSRPPG